MNGLPNFEEFLSDLLGCFIKDPVKVAFIKERLSPILSSLKIQEIQGVDRCVSEYLIPELSRLIQSTFGVSAEKQLISLKPSIIRGLETFLQKGRVLNKDEIIQLAKKNIPELIIETAIPNTSEYIKKLVRNAMNSVQEAVFTPGTTPSVEKLLHMLHKECADKEFCIDRAELSHAIDKLIELMPEAVDKIMEFQVKHVLPALSVCFEATAFALLTVFLKQCFESLHKEGTVRVRGKDLAKPLAMKALGLANEKLMKNTAKDVSKVAPKIVKKYVVDKAGRKMVRKATKKIASKASKNVVSKATQNASSKAAMATSKQSVKVGTKAINRMSGKAARQGVQGAAGKTAKEASVNITKTSSKAVAEVGFKNAAKAGMTAAGLSAVVGGLFLYHDLKDLDKEKEEGSLSAEEYKEQKKERLGEFVGDVIGTGFVGAAISVAALSGPAGWAAIGAGAIVSFATGKLGGQIAKAVA